MAEPLLLGPFRVTEIDQLKGILESRGVKYDFYIDEDVREQTMKEFVQRGGDPSRIGGGSLDLRIVFFEIDPADFPKAAAELEKLGITAPSDGSWELAED
ncbi:MAG TPA: hypothetical protein PKC28_13595 [Bdellovibrionales bacterium]|nr:hypothetical protein [Bdellovibrionales bacterium]